MEALVTSLVIEGVFERIPEPAVVLVEGGFAWLPSLCWRLDKHWRAPARRGAASEAPAVRIYPARTSGSRRSRSRSRSGPEHLLATFEWIGWDRIMFSTDYPHWDQDDPRYAFKVKMTEQREAMLFRDNAMAFYGLD